MEEKNKYEMALDVLVDEIQGCYRSPRELHKAVEDLKELIEIDKCKKRFIGVERCSMDLMSYIPTNVKTSYLEHTFKNAVVKAVFDKDSNIIPRLEVDGRTRTVEARVMFDIYPVVYGGMEDD